AISSLGLYYEEITDEDLVNLKDISSLKHLNLTNSKNLTDGGLKQLQDLKLETLNLSFNNFSDQALVYLIGMPLQELILSGNHKMTEEAINTLKKITTLRRVSVSGCNTLTQEKVWRHMPHCKPPKSESHRGYSFCGDP